ncbi:MAG: hypothetical protein M3Q29_13785 [Chloroflexota bacterium]|nr:hypothetical protein [Chloroflexota bacterium]
MTALAPALMLSVLASAQQGTATLTFQLTVTGDCPDDATFFGMDETGAVGIWTDRRHQTQVLEQRE